MFGSVVESLDYSGKGGGQFLMLPEADDLPTGLDERRVDRSIALDVLAELRRPVPFVGRRLSPMLRAGVPEASIDEHGNLPRSEDDVWPHSDLADVQAEVLAITKPETVQRFPQPDFRFGVRSAVSLHVPRSAFIQRGGVHTALVSQLAGLGCLALRHINIGSTTTWVVGQDTRRGLPPTGPSHRKGLL